MGLVVTINHIQHFKKIRQHLRLLHLSSTKVTIVICVFHDVQVARHHVICILCDDEEERSLSAISIPNGNQRNLIWISTFQHNFVHHQANHLTYLQ